MEEKEIAEYEYTCSDCKAIINEYDKICPKCGSILDGIQEEDTEYEFACSECQTIVNENDIVCPICGGDLRNVPVLYSRKAIDVFSGLMSPLFGSVMLWMNLRKIGQPKGAKSVLVFGILHLTLVCYIVFYDLINIKFPIQVLNIAGAAVLHYYYWNKYVGKGLIFQKRKIWKPLIIMIVFILATFVFFLLLLNYQI